MGAMMGPECQKIGLLHHIGGGNLGDDATQDAVIQNIKRRWPQAVMIGLSVNPDDTRKRHGIPSYAIRKKTWDFGYRIVRSEVTIKEKAKIVVSKYCFLFRLLRAINFVVIRMPKAFFQEIAFLSESFRIIRSCDLLIINGGGQLTEWGGPWGFPYTIFKWILLARLANVKRVFLNVGAGPLTQPLSKFFVRRALLFADYVSFRDEQSRALIYQIGFRGRSQVFPDNAYSLKIPALNVCNGSAKQGKALVGIAPMPYCDPRVFPEKNQLVYDSFIRKLGLFGSWLIRHNYCVTLFGSDIGTDPLAIEDLEKALRGESDIADSPCLINEPVSSAEELFAKMSSMNYVVTCRFHGVVFAHMLNKPVLAISHHPKVATLMHGIGLAKYCVDIRTSDLNLLTETFSALVSNSDEIKARMAEKLDCYRRQLTMQYDDLFPQLGR
jgi:polysaccharide pyruvyl transferase WcaK-like protein